MSPSDVIVIGAGGHAKVVVATLRAAGHRVSACYDDDPGRMGQDVLGVPIKGSTDQAPAGAKAVLAIGDNAQRQKLSQRLQLEWISVRHPQTTVDDTVRVEPGAVIFAGAIVQPDSVIGAHAIINTRASVDHDCRIGDFAHIAPGVHLAGGVHVGEGTMIGVAAKAIPRVSIGAWCLVGAGATCVADLPDRVQAQGTPARIVKELP